MKTRKYDDMTLGQLKAYLEHELRDCEYAYGMDELKKSTALLEELQSIENLINKYGYSKPYKEVKNEA